MLPEHLKTEGRENVYAEGIKRRQTISRKHNWHIKHKHRTTLVNLSTSSVPVHSSTLSCADFTFHSLFRANITDDLLTVKFTNLPGIFGD